MSVRDLMLRSTKHSLTPRLQAYNDSTSLQGGWSSNCVQLQLTQVVLTCWICVMPVEVL
jgi:hypothetical protein